MFKINLLIIVCITLFSSCKNNEQQHNKNVLLNDIPIVINLDSLEKSFALNKNETAIEQFKKAASLELSRAFWRTNKLGENFYVLDSLQKKINNKNVDAITEYIKSYYIIDIAQDETKMFNALLKCKNYFEQTKDTFGILNCYYNLFKLSQPYVAITNVNNKSVCEKNMTTYYTKVFELLNKATNTDFAAIALLLKADYERMVLVDYEKSLNIIDSGLIALKKASANTLTASFNYDLLLQKMNCYKLNETKNLDSFLKLNQLLMKLPKPVGSRKLMWHYMYVEDAYLELNQIDSAVKYTNEFGKIVSNFFKFKKYDQYKQFFDMMISFLPTSRAVDIITLDTEHSKLVNDNRIQLLEIMEKYRADEKETKNIILEKEKKQYKIIAIVALVILTLIALLLQKINKANKKLQQHDIFQEKILSIISHDLRSPLFALQGLNDQASYLLKHNKVTEFMPMATAIDDTSNKILNLLNNLLMWAVSQKNSNKKVVVTKLNISECVNATLDLFNNIIQSKQINIVKNIDENVIINGNKNVLELILRNWIDNTLKYATSNHIYINATQQATHTIIEIIDDGMIDATNEKLIQNQLQQHNNITIENNTGLGLGLIHFFSKQANWQVKLTVLQNKNTFSITIPA